MADFQKQTSTVLERGGEGIQMQRKAREGDKEQGKGRRAGSEGEPGKKTKWDENAEKMAGIRGGATLVELVA